MSFYLKATIQSFEYNFSMEIKEILIKLRKENNLTQKQVAGLLGMSATGYASWEQGLAEPSLTAIPNYAKYIL